MLISASLRALRKIMRTAEQGERKLAQATGLTPSQVLVLEEVDRGGNVMPSEVALALQLSQASITNIVDRLVDLELVMRRKGERDKRQVRLSLTERGHQMLQTAPDLLQNRFRRRFQTLPAWEQAMVLAGLERLADLLDEGEVEAAPIAHSNPIQRSAA